MILKQSLTSRRLEQKKFIHAHLGIQIYLLLTSFTCSFIASHLINVSSAQHGVLCNLTAQALPTNLTLAQVNSNFTLSAVSLITFGLIQSIPAIIFIFIHLLYGYIAKAEHIIAHGVMTVVQLVVCLFSAICVSMLLADIWTNQCASSAHSELAYGLPFLISVLAISVFLHFGIILLLLSVDFDVFKSEPTPVKIRLESHRSPAMFISRADLKGVNDPADLLRLHHVLRTRLPSLRSLHPVQPPSPGLINSLSEIPLTPFLTQPHLVFPATPRPTSTGPAASEKL